MSRLRTLTVDQLNAENRLYAVRVRGLPGELIFVVASPAQSRGAREADMSHRQTRRRSVLTMTLALVAASAVPAGAAAHTPSATTRGSFQLCIVQTNDNYRHLYTFDVYD